MGIDNKDAPRKPRVAVCIPAYASWEPQMGYCAMCLAIHSAPFVDITPAFTRGEDTSEARNVLVDEFKKHAAREPERAVDAILWIDSDMVFPADALLRLLAHRMPIVGADYRRRGPPFPRIGQWVNPENPFGPGVAIPEDAPRTGLDDEMAVIGFGLVLTRMRVFDIPKWPRPWFVRAWSQSEPGNPSHFHTEDSTFCTMARAHGLKVCCDNDLSAEVLHLAQTQVPWNLPRPIVNQHE
jgi:hypothetical protein